MVNPNVTPLEDTVSSSQATAGQPEDIASKVQRLAFELADALNEYAGGGFRAVIEPSGTTQSPVNLRNRHDIDQNLEEAIARFSRSAKAADPTIIDIFVGVQEGIEPGSPRRWAGLFPNRSRPVADATAEAKASGRKAVRP